MLIERDCVTGPSCISAPPSGPVGSPLREMSAVLGSISRCVIGIICMINVLIRFANIISVIN